MPTRNVVITDHQAALLDRLVASGRYQNVSEAMRAGLRALEEDEIKLDRLNLQLEAGMADIEAGRFAEGSLEEVVRRAGETARRRLAEKHHK